MTAASGLRHPVADRGLFTVLGLVVGGYGLATNADAARYAVSLGVNINLWWGLVMLVFGVLLLAAASRTGRAASARPSAESAEGGSTEERERRLGLEGGNRQE